MRAYAVRLNAECVTIGSQSDLAAFTAIDG